MQVRLPIILLMLFGFWGTLVTSGYSQDAPIKTSYTQLRKFTLPFRFDTSRGKPKELRLFYSLNNGPWRRGSSSNADQASFDVDLDQDGVYDFAVQAEYDNGTLEPTQLDQLRPHIRVVVDSSPPIPKIDAVAGNPGTGGVEWLVDDPNVDTTIDPKSVQLECRWPGQAEWMPIPGPFKKKDEYFWQLKPGQKLEVRIKATDRAKNVGYSRVVVTPPDANGAGGGYTNESFDANPNKNMKAKHYFINSKRISLETKVLVGKSGIAQVDLYQTDNMRNWTKVQGLQIAPPTENVDPAPAANADPNQPRPEFRKLTFEVQKEGLYGFIVGGKNGVGLGPGQPLDNTPPRVLIEVDLTPPSVAITEARVIPSGIRGNVLTIGWRVNDPNLAPKPIVIDITEDPKSPDKWTTIAQGVDNTPSRYTWPVPENAPPKFYVRIRAVDRATNTGEAISEKPVIADHHVPEFEIQGVEPLPGAPPR